MFIGHFALGFAAKRAAPRVSLAILFLAAQWADLLWPVLVAAGLEHVRIDPGNTAVTPLAFDSYPYSHSLVLLIVWGTVCGILFRTIAGKNGSAVAVLAGLVVSHWFLDFVTHRPDMPLYPGSPTFGLGLWNSIPATVVIEFTMYAAGVWLYVRTTRARDRVGRWSLPGLSGFLAVTYIVNIIGPPPPSVRAVWIAGFVGGAFLLVWSWWTDAHRRAIDTLD